MTLLWRFKNHTQASKFHLLHAHVSLCRVECVAGGLTLQKFPGDGRAQWQTILKFQTSSDSQIGLSNFKHTGTLSTIQ